MTLFNNFISNIKTGDNKHNNFKLLWSRILLLIMRREIILFILIILFYELLMYVTLASHNKIFARMAWKLTLLILGSIALIHLLLFISGVIKRGLWQRLYCISNERKWPAHNLAWGDFVLLLIPLVPIVQYVLLNQDVLSPVGSILFILVMGGGFFVFTILLPFILQKYLPVKGLVPLGVSLLYIYASMPLLSQYLIWNAKLNFGIITGGFISILAVVLFLYTKQRKLLYIMAALFFGISTANNVYGIIFKEKNELINLRINNASAHAPSSNLILKGELKKKPDIYLLTYDSYVEQAIMQRYGIDNSAQEDYLKKLGFKIYNGVYTSGPDTLMSMVSVLNVIDAIQPLERSWVETFSGNLLVTNILKENGYKTHGILNPYFFSHYKVAWDVTYPTLYEIEGNFTGIGFFTLLVGMKEGQFRFDVANDIGKFKKSEFIAAKRNIIKSHTNYPKFMYTHTGPNHSQNSGVCLENEIHLFEKRLITSNQEMKEDVNAILNSDREAIIIINGDHGPYLTGDCFLLNGYSENNIGRIELQDRYGAFLAIRWPDDNFEQYDDIKVLQDIFPAVFRYLFETERVFKERPRGIVHGYGSIADGFIADGQIMKGKDKGKPLFD